MQKKASRRRSEPVTAGTFREFTAASHGTTPPDTDLVARVLVID